MGQSAWLFDGIETQNISLTDVQHTRDDGYRFSFAAEINESGQVMGLAERYDAINYLGQSAWFFDTTTGQIYFNDFSIRASDGYAYSYGQFLSDNGLMLGYYEQYDTNSSFLGNRAFGFTVEDGFFDLELFIDGSLELFDWSNLANVVEGNDLGQILGMGQLGDMLSDSNAVYLATPSAVPVPAAAWLFGSGLILLIGAARQKS